MKNELGHDITKNYFLNEQSELGNTVLNGNFK